jgi:hypothetical protein
LKQAVESLMATNEEKNLRIEELRSALKRYKRMEEVLVKMQGSKILEQIGLDGDNVSDGSSARNSNGSCNENAHEVDTRVNVDALEGSDHRELLVSLMPNPAATSTPVNTHGVSNSPSYISTSLSRNPHLIGSPPSNILPPNSPAVLKTDTRSNSYDDIIGAPSKTPPPTVKRRADVYGTLPKDFYSTDLQSPSSGCTTPSSPSTPLSYSLQKRPPLPPHSSSATAAGLQVRSNTMPRKHRTFMSFGKGFLKIRNGPWSCSAPSLGDGYAFLHVSRPSCAPSVRLFTPRQLTF